MNLGIDPIGIRHHSRCNAAKIAVFSQRIILPARRGGRNFQWAENSFHWADAPAHCAKIPVHGAISEKAVTNRKLPRFFPSCPCSCHPALPRPCARQGGLPGFSSQKMSKSARQHPLAESRNWYEKNVVSLQQKC